MKQVVNQLQVLGLGSSEFLGTDEKGNVKKVPAPEFTLADSNITEVILLPEENRLQKYLSNTEDVVIVKGEIGENTDPRDNNAVIHMPLAFENEKLTVCNASVSDIWIYFEKGLMILPVNRLEAANRKQHPTGFKIEAGQSLELLKTGAYSFFIR